MYFVYYLFSWWVPVVYNAAAVVVFVIFLVPFLIPIFALFYAIPYFIAAIFVGAVVTPLVNMTSMWGIHIASMIMMFIYQDRALWYAEKLLNVESMTPFDDMYFLS